MTYPVTDCEVLAAINREIDEFNDVAKIPDGPIGDIHGVALKRIQQILAKLDTQPSTSGNSSVLDEMLVELHREEFPG